jgi:DNA ligase D-like protein (predicted polymerase)
VPAHAWLTDPASIYVGTYQGLGYTCEVRAQDGKLLMQMTSPQQPVCELESAGGEHKFQVPSEGARIVFKVAGATAGRDRPGVSRGSGGARCEPAPCGPYAAVGVASKSQRMTLDVGGYEVAITNPDKVYFPAAGITKLDVVHYYLAVADGALRGAGGRPNVLVRYADGIHGEFFYQKRAPSNRPPFVDAVEIAFPSGRTAVEVVPRNAATLAWMANLGCLELHPHPVRASDLDHPDELRIDLDPVPGVEWPQLQATARVVREVLDAHGLVGWPKTSGSRGIHVLVRIHPRWTFADVRRAALALAREVERRAPQLATSKWWKEERHGVFLDYNQNAKDRTVCSAYSVRPRPDARVSAPVTWDELAACRPEEFTLRTMPARVQAVGDRHAAIDQHPCALDALLALSAQQEATGLGDAPWPPHYGKQPGEPPRVQPSKRKSAPATRGRRTPSKPLLEIGRARKKDDALAGLSRWQARHPQAAAHLEPADILVDAMRGRSSTWTRVRINLEHVPVALRPQQEALDPDDVSERDRG